MTAPAEFTSALTEPQGRNRIGNRDDRVTRLLTVRAEELRADDRRRVVLPAPATPGSYWIPVTGSAQEIVLRAWQPPAGWKSPGHLAVMRPAPVKGEAGQDPTGPQRCADFPLPFREWIAQTLPTDKFEVVPLSPAIAAEALDLPGGFPHGPVRLLDRGHRAATGCHLGRR